MADRPIRGPRMSRVRCARCERELRVPNECIGRQVECRFCNHRFRLSPGSKVKRPRIPVSAEDQGPFAGQLTEDDIVAMLSSPSVAPQPHTDGHDSDPSPKTGTDAILKLDECCRHSSDECNQRSGTRSFATEPSHASDTGVASGGQQLVSEFAGKMSVDYQQRAPREFSSELEATEERNRLAGRLPRVDQAYMPSGKVPAGSYVRMLIAAQIGAAVAVLAGTAGALFSLLIGGAAAVATELGMGWFAPKLLATSGSAGAVVGALLGVLSGIALIHGGIGWSAATWVVRDARACHVRSPNVVAIFACCSALLGAVALGLAANACGLCMSIDSPGSSMTTGVANGIAVAALALRPVGSFSWILGIPAAIVAGATASLVARSGIRAFKYCERCDMPMQPVALPPLSIGGAKVLVASLEQGKIDIAVAVFSVAQADDCCTTLAVCPGCQRGYLDAELAIDQTYMRGAEKTTQPVSWLVASRMLSAGALSHFRAYTASETANKVMSDRGVAETTKGNSPWLGFLLTSGISSVALVGLLLLDKGIEWPMHVENSDTGGNQGEVPSVEVWTEYADPRGRFSCRVPPGWNIVEKAGDPRSNVRFQHGKDEIWIITRDTNRHVLDENDRREAVAVQQGIVQRARSLGGDGRLIGVEWTTFSEIRALQIEIEFTRPEPLWMRQIKFKKDGWDHLISLNVASVQDREKLCAVFRTFLEQYQSHPKKVS